MEPGWPNNPRQGMLDACEALHMLANGSLDGVTLADSDALAEWIRHRLNAWRPSTSTYDGIVKALAEVALAEYLTSREEALRRRQGRAP